MGAEHRRPVGAGLANREVKELLPPEWIDPLERTRDPALLSRVLARETLRGFGSYVTPAWDWMPRHIQLMADKLEAVERGEIKRLMFFLPPRSGKSELTSIHFPAWYMMRNPSKRIIGASYSTTLAEDFSRRARALVREHGRLLYGVELSGESAAADQWGLKGHHGQYVAAGYGAGITGRGCSLLILDDVVKNAEEANSPTYRQKIWDWYTSTAYTRLEPDGAVVICLTRWNLDDLAGRLLAEMEAGGEQWEVVRLPALAEDEDDALGREPGEPLWPERFGVAEYDRIRQAVGSYVWNALYQQRPMDVQGGVFKAPWIKWYTGNEIQFDGESWTFRGEPMVVYGGVDPAISEKDSADEFAFVTIGVTPRAETVVLECVHGHFDPAEQPKLIRQIYDKWHHERIGIEINSGQRYLYAQVRGDVKALGLNHRTDKYSRISAMAPEFESGQFYLREATEDEAFYYDGARLPGRRIHPSMQGLYEQLVTYTATSAHEDRIDALEGAWSVPRTSRSFLIQPKGPTKADRIDIANEELTTLQGGLQVAVEQGKMLPSAVVKAAPKPKKSETHCARCGERFTLAKGASRYCPTHGWTGSAGLPQEFYQSWRDRPC